MRDNRILLMPSWNNLIGGFNLGQLGQTRGDFNARIRSSVNLRLQNL